MSNPQKEHPSTYVVQDRDNQEELARLQLQDQMLAERMGGILPEQPDPTSFQRVLDIACGTGGWLIEAAKTYPGMTQLFGIDVSDKMLNYARAQAESASVSNRVEFLVMDALRMLEFPTHFFDLVNMRLAQSWLRTWDWPKLLQEAQRVSKPGGVIRFTEADGTFKSNSSALSRLNDLGTQAMYRSGHYFTEEGNSILIHLPRLMHQQGILNVQTRAYTIAYHAGAPEGRLFADDMKYLYRTAQPFLKKWTRIPDDYEAIYQQALADMQAPDFVATWDLLTVWGTNEGFSGIL
jgi:ubiquinone/menaquinone biosynthesis C-methylase UbiE